MKTHLQAACFVSLTWLPTLVSAQEGAPAESASDPAESAGAPADSAGAPAESASDPADSAGAPAESASDPAESAGAPAESAAEEEAPPSLLRDLRLGAYGEFGIGMQSALDTALVDLNVGGSVIFDRRFSIGAQYRWNLGEPRPNSELDERLYYDTWSVGARMEYLFLHDRLLPIGVALGGGVGEVDADLLDGFDSQEDSPFGEDLFYFVAPEVNVQAVLWDYVRARLSAGYRFTGDVDYRGASNADLAGPFVQLSILAGYFGKAQEK